MSQGVCCVCLKAAYSPTQYYCRIHQNEAAKKYRDKDIEAYRERHALYERERRAKKHQVH